MSLRTRKLLVRFTVALLAVVFFATQGALADDLYGRIRGQATDKTGAAVPGVSVTATNLATGLTRTATTNDAGFYEFANLPVGPYSISATKDGFKNFKADRIPLQLNQIYLQNVPLEVGTTGETVTVEGNVAQVETTNSQLGTVINGSTITDLPLNGRNWVQLQQTIPGVVASSDRFGSNFATNGSQSQQNSYLINGTDSNDLPLNTPLIIPSPDAIGEFNLVTNTINPEYGRNSGAILNAVIKSGTNNFHGTAFEFYRDSFLNATRWFATKNDQFHQNQFGGTIGGPILKDKLFFFGSYQGTRNRQPQAGFGDAQVFTAAERQGIFNPGRNKDGTCAQFSGPAAGFPQNPATCDVTVPASAINPISAALLQKFVPLPNSGQRDFVFNPITAAKTDQELFRADYNLTKADNIYFYGLLQRAPSIDTIPFTGANVPGFGDQNQSHVQQYTAAWNHIFSGTTINELRAGYTRLNFNAVLPQTPILPSSVGFNITPQNPAGAGLPTINIIGDQNLTLGFTTNGPQPRIDQTYQLTDNFSHVMGKHSLKFGFEGRDFRVNNPFFAVNNGNFDFAGNGPNTTGNPGLDFLIGNPDDFSQGSGGFIDARAQEYYAYFQDQFKIRPSFTLTYGAGYQVDTPLNQNANNGVAINCFTPGQQSKVFPTAPVGLNFPGDPGCSRSGYSTKWGHVGPRLGFAWAPNLGWLGNNGKFSIRGGYGIYFNRSEEELTLQTLGTPPFGINASVTAPNFANPFAGSSNPFPFTPPAPGSSPAFCFNGDPTCATPFLPLSISVIDPNFTTPYAENFNLNIERELASQMVFQIGYVGSVAHHLIRTIEQNPVVDVAGCLADPTCRNNRTDIVDAAPQFLRFPAAAPLTAPDAIAGRGFIGSVGEQRSDGNSNYNSLQVSLKKNTTHGIYFLLGYTYSHSLGTVSSFENSGFGGSNGRGSDPFNQARDYSDTAFDARHRFVASYTYSMPFKFQNGFVDRALGGWALTGITTFQTGFPVFVRDTGFRSLECPAFFMFYSCWDAPNQVVGNIQTFDPRQPFGPKGVLGQFFDPADFARAPIGTQGNASRAPLHGPGINNWDMALHKNIAVTEGTHIELRLEGFNVFNHAQFNNPNNSISAGTFGRITTAKAPRQVQLGAKFIF